MQQKLRRIPYYGSLALLAYMPFHVFLSQWLSLYTGGLDIWKLAKDGVLAVVTLFAVCLVWWRRSSTRLFNYLVIATVAYLLLHLLVWWAHPDAYRNSALLGIIYNNRLFCYLLLGMSAVLLYPEKFNARFWVRLTLGLGTVVAGLGILQWFLPHDILTHFGYGLSRGTRAAFYIDDKSAFPRIMSTLREPNALGAFLILPLSLVAGLWLQTRNAYKRKALTGMFGLQALAILLTFSRSAWLGAVVALGFVGWQTKPEAVRMFVKRFGFLIAALLVVGGVAVALGRHTPFIQSYIIHGSTQEQTNNLNSDDYHRVFIKRGLSGIVHQPLGHGPGTAGLASIQNPKGSFLTENYYVQIGYEVGVLGLLLFAGVQVLVYVRLWRVRHDNILVIGLLGSFWAYALINMLLHAWSNEAEAAQWWILAGLALAAPALKNHAKSKD